MSSARITMTFGLRASAAEVGLTTAIVMTRTADRRGMACMEVSGSAGHDRSSIPCREMQINNDRRRDPRGPSVRLLDAGTGGIRTRAAKVHRIVVTTARHCRIWVDAAVGHKPRREGDQVRRMQWEGSTRIA